MSDSILLKQRRKFLLRALAGGFLYAAGPAARGQILGRVPRELPGGQSIYELRGEVTVNKRTATPTTRVTANDTISTGKSSQLVFVVGKDAFILRENSALTLVGEGLQAKGLRLATGALLSVFGSDAHTLLTPAATIGIRGTGMYVEARPDQTYLCTCYGTVDVAVADGSQRETIVSRHHDAPRYILASGDNRIRPAPVVNHTDLELTLIEALVGRTPPFGLFDESYGQPHSY